MSRYLIGVGSSHPQGAEYIMRTHLMLSLTKHVSLKGTSKLHRSAAAGGITYYPFINAAFAIETALCPDALWMALKRIENSLGRIRLSKNGPRTLDLDILWWAGLKIKTSYVEIPHPQFLARKFARIPGLQAAQKAGWTDKSAGAMAYSG